MTEQVYEDYWDVTLATTDIYGDKFNDRLKLIVDFISENKPLPYSPDKYRQLEDKLLLTEDISEISVRKNINQYIKLGFVEPFLSSYHEDTPAFLEEKNSDKKKTLFSKIIYSNSGFKKAVTDESDERQINFIVKTLEEVKKIKKTDLAAFLITEISSVKKGFLNQEELKVKLIEVNESGFAKRKYNQINHLWTILGKLDGFVVRDSYLYLVEDAPEVEAEKEKIGRDAYSHGLYKNLLKEESVEKIGKTQCMVENLEYPVLIASHIKPFRICSINEAYDPSNGLLLSRNMDVLFDLGYISFTREGDLLVSDRLSLETKNSLLKYKLNNLFITPERVQYLLYHKENVFR